MHIVLPHICSELDQDGEEHSNSSQDPDIKAFESILVREGHLTNTHDEELDDVEILAIDVDSFEYDDQTFLGACFDSGAQRTVIGKPQADTYKKLTGVNCGRKRRNMGTVFRFGLVDHKVLEEMSIRLPLGDNHFIPITAHIVSLDVSLLLELDVM